MLRVAPQELALAERAPTLGFHDEVAIISIIVTSIKEFMQWFAPAELALTRRAPML